MWISGGGQGTMRYRFITLFCCYVFITSCGKFRAKFIEPEVLPYLEVYNQYKIEYLGQEFDYGVNVFFEDLKDNRIGECKKFSDGYRKINIDFEFWERASGLDREVLVLHELGHCDLGLGHTEGPAIMQKFHLNGLRYNREKDFYLSNFFGLQASRLYDSLEKIKTKCY